MANSRGIREKPPVAGNVRHRHPTGHGGYQYAVDGAGIEHRRFFARCFRQLLFAGRNRRACERNAGLGDVRCAYFEAFMARVLSRSNQGYEQTGQKHHRRCKESYGTISAKTEVAPGWDLGIGICSWQPYWYRTSASVSAIIRNLPNSRNAERRGLRLTYTGPDDVSQREGCDCRQTARRHSGRRSRPNLSST